MKNYNGQWGETMKEAMAKDRIATKERKAAQRAEIKRRKAKVIDIQSNGKYVSVEFINDAGERVIARYVFDGWSRMPGKEMAEFMAKERANAASGLPIEVYRTSKESGRPPRDLGETPRS